MPTNAYIFKKLVPDTHVPVQWPFIRFVKHISEMGQLSQDLACVCLKNGQMVDTLADFPFPYGSIWLTF